MTLREHPIDPFERFLAVYPERDGGHDVEATRHAWDSALRRASAETIIRAAVAYAEATECRERRYIMSPRRWLSEARWRDVRAPGRDTAPLVWVALDTPEWRAWAAFYRSAKGKSPPLDRRGGWRFPSKLPPATA